MLTRVLAMLALVAAAGATGVFAGRASHDPDAGWSRGYNAGIRAQRDATRGEPARIAARYAPGTPAFESIYAAGVREGRRLGRYEGLVAGRRSGFRDGAIAALPDFPGGWRPQHWYLIRLERDGSGFRVAERVNVARERRYGTCPQDPARMCVTPGASGSSR